MSRVSSSDDRQTALGLFHYARSYRAAADHLLKTELKATHPQAPVTFLFYHSIELYLKAFLRLKGLTPAELKGMGHRYDRIAAAASGHGLKLLGADEIVVNSLAKDDAWSRSRYIETGAFTRPAIQELSLTCKSLDASVAADLRGAGYKIRRSPTRAIL